ncbi:class I adenylate-forming enzyme family protein [Haladaptatus sp. CMAA 1911]|uniref:class I adenylate-forming enzyme family protein n=1 Tax=unclassified Haladaptatus TaxID=2622732 RepID=UPI003754953D
MSLLSARHAGRWGNRTAIVDEDERVSYAELDARVGSMAGRLAALGIEPGDSVALVSRNCAESLVSMLAVWRVGGVFAPVSHRLTPATVSRPMDRIDPDLVLFESAQRDLVREFDARSFEEVEHVSPADFRPAERADGEAALHVHTEDGTRVVELSTRAVEWNCRIATAGWGLGRNDCTITLWPLSRPDCLLGFVLPLLTVGGRVVTRRAFDPDDATTAIEEYDVTCLVAGPTEFRELADAGFDGTPAALEWMAARGRVPPDVREAFSVSLLPVHGRAETGVNVLRGTPGSGEVAYPFPNCAVRIDGGDVDTVDEANDGAGTEMGELLVRSPATATGHLDGEAFGDWVAMEGVFRREANDTGGYLLVGDGVDSSENGKRRPRVHPRAVETVLESHPDVREVGIVETVSETGGTAPKALVVGDVSPGQLREFAEERLAPYEVPRAIEPVPSLPRRPTGELDRAALRGQFVTRS